VNSLLNAPLPIADQKEGQVEHKMMSTNPNDTTLHGTVLHDTVPVVANLASKFHAGNSV
jgi:hypothetical protein